MMREILFRGKRKDNGEWVEGAFCLKDCDGLFAPVTDKPSIIKYEDPFSGFWFQVGRDTVGQFTGLTDKNGKKVFEGDIVFTEHGSIHEEDGNAVIEWDEDTARFVVKWDGLICDFDNFYGHDLEVIGNIHDNPELLNQ